MRGERVADRFVIEAEAGRGGMGTVYRALDEVGGEVVALKLLRGDDAVDVARFEREARVLSRLEHPNVVRYLAHGSTPKGHVYLAMEWLDGETLAARLARGSLSVTDALAVVSSAAAGLGAAHGLGVIHRDVKPGNLFLCGSDPSRVKLLDFGIARGVGAGHTLTTTGNVVGTPYYMAPEQARAVAGVDARADVYALGAVLYEMLTGRPPFVSDSLMAVLAAILLEEPVDVRVRAPHVPEGVAALAMRLLAKDPSERPADGAALGATVRALGDRPEMGPRSIAPPALTEREQRVRCLILAAGHWDAVAGATTLDQKNGDDPLERLRAAVEAHGGRVELLADGSTVARVSESGTPVDQAVRAAHCALAMRELAPDLPIAAVAGRGHFRGPVPVGEVIERGSALLSHAALGASTLRHGALGGSPTPERTVLPIRLDEIMAGLLESRFEIGREAGGATLGKERVAPTTSRTLLGKRSPCVGRARELGTLEALYREAIDEPVARAVVITAPAGLGKSRLVAELLDRLESGPEPPAVWSARGDPLAAGSPFGLVSQLVRSAASITEGEPLERRRDKLISSLVTSFGDDAKISWLAVRLGDLARIPFSEPSFSLPPDDPKLRGDAMREAFLDWLEAVLARRPLVLVLDDLQWGDHPSLAFLDAALRELAESPLLVVAAGRPELHEVFGELWADRDAQLLRLARLRPKSAEKLVRHGLPSADPSLVAKLVERADGNPFFLEELVRAVAENGDDHDLPTTVLGMVEARLAVLEPSTRRVLRAASVFGRRFWRGGVVELLGGEARAGDVDTHLALLARREVVDEVELSRFEGERELAFRHALTREAALAMLTDEDRALGHRLAGAWLERAGEADALVLAEHFARGGEPPRAARWLGRSAEQALEGDDLLLAVERAERALDATEETDRGAILVTLADALRWRGEYREALERASEAAEALPTGSRAWFRALGVLFAAAGRLGHHEEARTWEERARSATADDDAVSGQVVALCRAAAVALGAGARDRFEATMADAEALARERAPADPLARAWLRTLRASEALRAGDHGAFVDGTADAVAAYEAAGDLRDACNQKVRLGNGYVGLGDPERAEVVLREALAGARRMGLRLVEGYALQNLGHALLRRGHLAEARETEERAVALARALEDPVLEAGCLLYSAESRELSLDAAGAVRDATRAVSLLDAVPPFRAVARAILGRALVLEGRPDLALVETTAAIAAIAGQPVEEGEAIVQLAHALALLASGSNARAGAIADAACERLIARAQRITDAGWREAFLHRVPTHARLMELRNLG